MVSVQDVESYLPSESLRNFWCGLKNDQQRAVSVAAGFVSRDEYSRGPRGSGRAVQYLERENILGLSEQAFSKAKYQDGEKEGFDTKKFCVSIVTSLKAERGA